MYKPSGRSVLIVWPAPLAGRICSGAVPLYKQNEQRAARHCTCSAPARPDAPQAGRLNDKEGESTSGGRERG